MWCHLLNFVGFILVMGHRLLINLKMMSWLISYLMGFFWFLFKNFEVLVLEHLKDVLLSIKFQYHIFNWINEQIILLFLSLTFVLLCLCSDHSSDFFINLLIIVKNTLWDLTKYIYFVRSHRISPTRSTKWCKNLSQTFS